MSIQIYNSLSKKKEDLVPLKEKQINLYSCGVTVYDKCHIGHARSLYIFDCIRKYLQYRGYQVKFVRNITDVDDKIINKANELKKSFAEVVKENIALYYKDLESLGIDRADVEPRATENIKEMIEHIKGLIAKGFAYAVDGDVYFNVRKFTGYGKLSGQSIEKMKEAVRIDEDVKKNDPLDFALWKKAKEGEPHWSSPWGEGRPGWHIECSAMSVKHLGCETLDIHAGGRDLIFPHHENEIAQSESLSDKPFAKYWIHHGLLTINGQKMAKSLGNFITVEEAVKKYSSDDLKMFFLLSHYASPVDFTEEKMSEAHKALERIAIFSKEAKEVNEKKLCPVEVKIVEEAKANFIKAMDDDFNTPKALSVIYDLISEVYRHKRKESYGALISIASNMIMEFMQNIFGLFKTKEEISEDIKGLLNKRQEAKAKKDFAASDKIREELKQKGIIVEDGKNGQTWRKA